MKKIAKNFMCFSMVFIMLTSFAATSFAVNVDDSIILNENGYVSLKKGECVDTDLRGISEAKLVTIDVKSISKNEEKEIEEIVNNGTDIFIECSISDEVSEIFSKQNSIDLYDENSCLIGWYIHNQGMGIKKSPVRVICMYEKGKNISSEEYLSDCLEIAVNFEAVPHELYNYFNNYNTLEEIYKQADDNEKIKLQSADTVSLTNLYYDDEIFYYAFGKKTLSHETKWDETEPQSGYYTLGYGKIHLLLSKIGNALGRNYDNMVVITSVGGDEGSNYYVVDYTTGLGVSGKKTIEACVPKNTSNETVSVNYGTSVNSEGTVSYDSSVSVSTNPDGQSFEHTYYGEDSVYVYSYPMSNKRGKGWSTVSGLVASANVGTQTIFVAGITSLVIKNIATYTLSDNYVTLMVSVKDHKVLAS